jgi:hypothetical protein
MRPNPSGGPEYLERHGRDRERAFVRVTQWSVTLPASLRSSSALDNQAAFRDQVPRVGGLDPASQLLAPPRARPMTL